MLRTALRLIAAALLGYLLIALLQTLVLELMLGGRVAPEAALPIQLAGVAGTVASGLVGGYFAAWLGRSRAWLHANAVLVPLALDAVYVIYNGLGGHPLWYSLGGASTLMVATSIGGWWRARSRNAPRAQPSTAAAE